MLDVSVRSVHSMKFYRANFASLAASSFSGFTSLIGWPIAVDNLAIVPLASDFGTLVLARRAPYNPFKTGEFLRSFRCGPASCGPPGAILTTGMDAAYATAIFLIGLCF